MELLRTNAEAALTDLSERFQEQAARYRAEADAGFCPELLREIASGWESHHRALVEHLRGSDVLPRAARDEHEALTRYVDRLKAWFSPKDDRAALLDRLREREAELTTAIDEALAQVSGEASTLLGRAREHAEDVRRRLERESA